MLYRHLNVIVVELAGAVACLPACLTLFLGNCVKTGEVKREENSDGDAAAAVCVVYNWLAGYLLY